MHCTTGPEIEALVAERSRSRLFRMSYRIDWRGNLTRASRNVSTDDQGRVAGCSLPPAGRNRPEEYLRLRLRPLFWGIADVELEEQVDIPLELVKNQYEY